MATLSLRMRDDLKAKAQLLASERGVSQNSFINATLAATVAQAETLAIMGERFNAIDTKRLHARVLEFMSESQSGTEPSPTEFRQAISDN